MFPTGIETVVFYRQKDFQREAERMRLINALQCQNFNAGYFQKITNWIGVQLMGRQSEFVPKKQIA